MSKVKRIEQYLIEFNEVHQNPFNKIIHWVCIPIGMFSFLLMLYIIPFPGGRGLINNWAAIFMTFYLIYYLVFSFNLSIGLLLITGLMLVLNDMIYVLSDFQTEKLIRIFSVTLLISFLGEFIGHQIEGKAPDLIQRIRFFTIAPLWLLYSLYKKIGISF